MNQGDKIITKESIVTIIFLALNVAIFIVELATGYGSGTMKTGDSTISTSWELYTPYVLEDGQWYRVITACFIHRGFPHLFSNMISLIIIGQYVEKYFGRIRYIILYLGAGICGNLLVMLMDTVQKSYPETAGASGAIFGLFSILLVFSIDEEMRNYFPMDRVMLGIVLMLLPSVLEKDISWEAHVGGLVAGVIISFIFFALRKRNR